MQALIISGSHRKQSQSSAVAHKIIQLLPAASPESTVDFIDLSEVNLPFWHEGIWQRDALWQQTWLPLSAKLKAANAIIVIAPEWAGMVPPALKNFLLYCDDQEVAHKPGLIVGVSASQGGAYPIAELRMSGYKNNRLCWIPDHVIVRQPQTELEKADPPSDHPPSIGQRLSYSLKMLAQYAKALDRVRAEAPLDYKRFPYGM